MTVIISGLEVEFQILKVVNFIFNFVPQAKCTVSNVKNHDFVSFQHIHEMQIILLFIVVGF